MNQSEKDQSENVYKGMFYGICLLTGVLILMVLY